MNQLTSKELMLIEDVIGMEQYVSQFANYAAQQISDQQLKSLCQQMEREHQSDIQSLASFVTKIQTH